MRSLWLTWPAGDTSAVQELRPPEWPWQRHDRRGQGDTGRRAGRLSIQPARQCQRSEGRRAMQVAYPDADAPGVLFKLGNRVAPGRRRRRHRRLLDHLSAQGFSARLQPSDRTLNCPGHYSRFDARPAAMQTWGTQRKTSRSTSCASTPKATSTPKASTSLCTDVCPTFSEGRRQWPTSEISTGCPSSRRMRSVQRRLPLLHRRMRLSCARPGRSSSKAARNRNGSLQTRTEQAAPRRDGGVVRALDVQVVKQNGAMCIWSSCRTTTAS